VRDLVFADRELPRCARDDSEVGIGQRMSAQLKDRCGSTD